MKALSIRQPWASLIVHGIKDIENRTWACPGRYIGQRVLIHASAKPVNMRNPSSVFTRQQWDFLTEEQKMLTISGAIPTSSIIGSVEIVDCVINDPSVWAEKTENYTVGMNPKLHEDITGKKLIYNWVLANPILFEKPIPAKGKLSFWDFDGVIEKGGIIMNNLSTSIATSREQSERLLAMGIKPETADMTHHYTKSRVKALEWELRSYSPTLKSTTKINIDKLASPLHKRTDGSQMTGEEVFESIWGKDIPAWSLSRLISMMPTNINGYSLDINFDNKSIKYSKTNCCDTADCLYIEGYEDLFDSIIAVIAWLIKSNHFNKEYLK